MQRKACKDAGFGFRHGVKCCRPGAHDLVLLVLMIHAMNGKFSTRVLCDKRSLWPAKSDLSCNLTGWRYSMGMRGKTEIRCKPACGILCRGWQVFLGSSMQLIVLSMAKCFPGERQQSQPQPRRSEAGIPFPRGTGCAEAHGVCMRGRAALDRGQPRGAGEPALPPFSGGPAAAQAVRVRPEGRVCKGCHRGTQQGFPGLRAASSPRPCHGSWAPSPPWFWGLPAYRRKTARTRRSGALC